MLHRRKFAECIGIAYKTPEEVFGYGSIFLTITRHKQPSELHYCLMQGPVLQVPCMAYGSSDKSSVVPPATGTSGSPHLGSKLITDAAGKDRRRMLVS